MLDLTWEAELRDTRMGSLAAAREAAFPDTRARARCPPLLPRELVWGLRLAAARAFKVRPPGLMEPPQAMPRFVSKRPTPIAHLPCNRAAVPCPMTAPDAVTFLGAAVSCFLHPECLLSRSQTRSTLPVQELGLRDAAVFDGWVVPPHWPEQASSEGAALTAAASGSGQGGTPPEDAPPVTALPSLRLRTYPRGRAVLTQADMEKAARLHEDRDANFDMQGEILPDGTEVRVGSLLPLPSLLKHLKPQYGLPSRICQLCSPFMSFLHVVVVEAPGGAQRTGSEAIRGCAWIGKQGTTEGWYPEGPCVALSGLQGNLRRDRGRVRPPGAGAGHGGARPGGPRRAHARQPLPARLSLSLPPCSLHVPLPLPNSLNRHPCCRAWLAPWSTCSRPCYPYGTIIFNRTMLNAACTLLQHRRYLTPYCWQASAGAAESQPQILNGQTPETLK